MKVYYDKDCDLSLIKGKTVAIIGYGSQALKNESFDLVFMDMVMPQMDGIEASKSIRSTLDCQVQRLPILGLSANVNSSDRERFIHAGADDFLLKPYDRQTLVEIIERLLVTTAHAAQ